MATVDFEGIAPNNSFAEVPDGYFGLDWDNFFAFGKKFLNANFNGIGSQHIIEGKGVGGIPGAATTSTISSDETTFTLKVATVASDFNNGETMTFHAFRDGSEVGIKEVVLDQNATEIHFGRNFRHIDTVTITATGGEDATVTDGGAGQDCGIENLIIKVDHAAVPAEYYADYNPSAYHFAAMHAYDWLLA